MYSRISAPARLIRWVARRGGMAGARIPSRTYVRGNPFPRSAGAHGLQDENPADSGDEIGISSQRSFYTLSKFALIISLFFGAGVAAGPNPDSREDAEFSPLARKEQMIRDRFERFKDRVFRLREQLAQSEPQNAQRLAKVLAQAGERGLSARLDEMIRLLDDPSSLTTALDSQLEWGRDVERLLSILLEQDSDNQQRDRRIERLKEFRREISQILDKQRALRDQSMGAGSAANAREQLDAALRKLNVLDTNQFKVSSETTRQANSTDATENKELSDRQEKLSQDAQALAQDLKDLAESESARSGSQAQSPSASNSIQSGQESVKEAGDAMSQAAESLAKGQPSAAAEQQEEAREAIHRARDRLQEARKSLEEQSEKEVPGQAQKQLAERTRSLSQQMGEGSEGPGSQGSGQPQSGGESGPAPGAQEVDQAQRDMDSAAESLDRQAHKEAAENQQSAVEELEQALRELEEDLNQLRKEDRAETLRDLEARFRRMLSAQRSINASTADLAALERDAFQRAEQLQLAGLAAKERDLSEQAATSAHILDEEGTTVVFPQVVGQLAEDMEAVAERLAEREVGPITQTVEREVVDTLEQLLEAVQRMQQENEQQAGGSSSNSEDQPLLPGSAELKLLRSSQVRVNSRTAAIEEARTANTESKESLARTLLKTAERQAQCAEMATNMRDRKQMP